MPRIPLTAVEAAFVRLAHDAAGLTEAKARVADLLAPLFAAHGVAPGTAGVSIEHEDMGLVLVTPEPEAPDFATCARCPHRVVCGTRERCSLDGHRGCDL